MSSISTSSARRDVLLLVLVCTGLFGLRLGSSALPNPDESRYAEISREMVATGDWVTPRLNGINYFEKPPLVYWLVGGLQKMLGLSEWVARAVPALFALGGVLLVYATARRLHGRAAGLAAGLVLATSLLYFALARILLLDMAVSVLMSAALCCFILGVREPPGSRRRWLFYGLYASMAFATLTKGLIGFMVTGAVMFLWLLVFNQWHRLRPLHLPTGALLFLAIAAPWHVLAAQRNETWFHRYIIFEHWERFTSPVAARPGKWWYFIPILLAGLFPWTGFLWGALRDSLRGGWSARKQNADAWFFVTWAAFIFLFFSKSNSKLPPYILPVFPALAVLIGAWLAQSADGEKGRYRIGLRVYSAVSALLGGAILVAVLKAGLIIRDPQQAEALRPYGLVIAAIALAGAVVVPWVTRGRGARAAIGAMVAAVALFYAALTFAVPNIQRPGTKQLALIVKARAQPGDRVVHYHEFFHDFTYYAERVVDVVNGKGELELEEDAAARASDRFPNEAEFRRRWAGPGRLWVVAEKSAAEKLFADPSFHYYLLGESRVHYLFSNQP